MLTHKEEIISRLLQRQKDTYINNKTKNKTENQKDHCDKVHIQPTYK